MKQKNVLKQFLRSWFPQPQQPVKDIHVQLAETIAERKRILPKWEKLFLVEPDQVEKDIHQQLAETIAQYKRERQEWEGRLFTDNSFGITRKNAA